MLHENLIFVICAPRSGSTMLQRMLGSHSQIFTHPEPHLLTPLAYLGYYQTVEKAPYDHVNAAQALREFCQELPGGEEDYLDACRAYASTLYERILAPSKKTYFLDKTPAYGLILPFLKKLYPRAKYVVLTRHPLAILHSYAQSFFDGDYGAAHEANPVVARYVAAIGSFLLEPGVDVVRVRYEDLVQNPEGEMHNVLAHLGLPFEPAVVTYGEQKHISKSYGDPMGVEKHKRPVTGSLETWASDLRSRPEALRMAEEIVKELDPEHVEAWGFHKHELLTPVTGAVARSTKRAVNGYRVKRQVLLAVRKNIQNNGVGDAVRKVRYYCDVLLRN